MQQPIDDPGLATKFGRKPASRVSDEGEGGSQHDNPQHPAPAPLEEPLAPEQEEREPRDGDENGSQSYHDVIAIVEEFDRVGPLIRRKGIESLHLGGPTAVGQKAQHVRDDDGIVESPMWCIRLTNNDNACASLRLEEALHPGQLGWLVHCDLLPFQVSTWEELEQAGNQPYNHP